MSLLGVAIEGLTGAGQYYLNRKERQRALKQNIDLENYRNNLFLRKLREEQKLRDKINEYLLKKHALDLEAQNQYKTQLKKIDVLKDAALHGSENAIKQLKELGVDISGIKYPIGIPKPKTGTKLTGFSTQLKEVNNQLKSLKNKYLESQQVIVYDPSTKKAIGYKTIKKINWDKASPIDRKRYIELQNRKNQILTKMSTIQKLPLPPKPAIPFNEIKYIEGQKPNEYGPSILSPIEEQKIKNAGWTQEDINQAINKFRAEYPQSKLTDYELIKRMVSQIP